MKTHAYSKGKGNTRLTSQQTSFQFKQRVLLSLNKLADRDTYQIGVDQLEKTAQALTPDGVAPFLSCVIDTDSGQKSTVRKECIRLMGTLVSFHQELLSPHLGKMVASIVKRLKDPDSIVRDACVEVVGVFSSKLNTCQVGNDGEFVAIVKPLFVALGDQNRHVQSGSALCLASVINNAINPPLSILSRMLSRLTKFLKNPHFMAKSAVIELIRSIIQVGGASNQTALSSAVRNIEEALKNSDWTTRKAASVALAGIAVCGGSSLQSIKASCVRSLESCRFDKVKPVRDSVLQALERWRSLPGSDSCEASETGSSTKENFCGGDYSDLTSASDGGWKDSVSKNVGSCSLKKQIPLVTRKTSPNLLQGTKRSKENDWPIEVVVPKTCNVSSACIYNDNDSKVNCFSKTSEKTGANAILEQDIDYDYVSVGEKPECSSVSNCVSSNFENKCVADVYDCFENSGLTSPLATNHHSEAEVAFNEHLSSKRLRERESLDSTVTEVSPPGRQECCSQTQNEISSIRKQLLEIETKQSNLMDMLQVFVGNTMDSLSTLESNVLGLGHAVDRIAQNLVQANQSNLVNSKLLKCNQSVSSPRYSFCTPRPSLDIINDQLPLMAKHNRGPLGDATYSNSRPSTSDACEVEMRRDARLKINRNPAVIGMQRSLGRQSQNTSFPTRRAGDVISSSGFSDKNMQCSSESKTTMWKRVKEFLCTGDLDSAFVEVLCSGDDKTLIELLDRTGPVLEKLSHETVGEILSTLGAHLLDQKFLGSIIPWLQQVVNLSSTCGPDYLVLTARARVEFLAAIQEAASMNFSNIADRRSVAQLALKLRQVWGKFS